MALAKKSTAVPAIDTHKDIVYPKDFSFKAVSSFSGKISRRYPHNYDHCQCKIHVSSCNLKEHNYHIVSWSSCKEFQQWGLPSSFWVNVVT